MYEFIINRTHIANDYNEVVKHEQMNAFSIECHVVPASKIIGARRKTKNVSESIWYSRYGRSNICESITVLPYKYFLCLYNIEYCFIFFYEDVKQKKSNEEFACAIQFPVKPKRINFRVRIWVVLSELAKFKIGRPFHKATHPHQQPDR